MVVAGRNIRQSQQEIRRDLKVVGNSNKALAGQLACLFRHDTTQCASVHANRLRQLNLGDISTLAQVTDSIHCISGEPFFLHLFVLLSFLVSYHSRH